MLDVGRVLHWLPDVDMRNGHEGLAQIIKKELKVNVEDLKRGEFVLCINTSWTQFKMYGAHNLILHYRRPEGGRLNHKALLRLPAQGFGRGVEFAYKQALTDTIEADFTERYPGLAKALSASRKPAADTTQQHQ